MSRPIRSCTINTTMETNENTLIEDTSMEPPHKRLKATSLLSPIQNDPNQSTTSDYFCNRASKLRARGLLKPNPKYSEEAGSDAEEEIVPKKRGRKPGKNAASKVESKKSKRDSLGEKGTPIMVRQPGEAASRFGCGVCGKNYRAKNGFERHYATFHAGKNLYGCRYCSHTSKRKDNLKMHHMSRHKDEVFDFLYPVGYDSGHDQTEMDETNLNVSTPPALSTTLSETLQQSPVHDSTFTINSTRDMNSSEHISINEVTQNMSETVVEETLPYVEEQNNTIVPETTVIAQEEVVTTANETVEMFAERPLPRTRAPSSYDEVFEPVLRHPKTEPMEATETDNKQIIRKAVTEVTDGSTIHNEATRKYSIPPPPRIAKREMIVPPSPIVPAAQPPKTTLRIPPFTNIRHIKQEVIEIVDDTPHRMIVDVAETIQYVIREYATNEPNKLFVIWDEDFSQDVAYSVVKQSSNCILALRKCSYTSFGKFCSSFVKGAVECPQIRIDAEKDKSLHLLTFGATSDRMIKDQSYYRTHSDLERELVTLLEKGDITHIIRYSEDPNSWNHQIVNQLTGPVIRTNKYFN